MSGIFIKILIDRWIGGFCYSIPGQFSRQSGNLSVNEAIKTDQQYKKYIFIWNFLVLKLQMMIKYATAWKL